MPASVAPSAVVLTLLAAAVPAQTDAPPNPLRVAFVGAADGPRTESFRAFLRERFAAVEVVDRASCDPSELAGFDVVLLDWSQQDGVIAWMNDEDARAQRSCPLGERSSWTTPTVLLGSAGLNVACAWDVRGGSG